ncbi:multi-sensor hybrid histidine kinase [Hydrogenophaga taeniospiralis CCUG 15921]|uniref:Sensory/regulatory protein RpfC n=1 Tax=Hydrogenophaga taeniospiralis CCUG 15921 TaxID=1281780 RepID=A0A9X4SHV3_9BURK|nr:ATP-binding protein [Hydrogenophaga taeniospiralis]MDG5978406.1 multi-sensor hybrid histidine kinase [Hydrogenophaga taeniospiralis CCUG 15921]
MPTTPQRIAQDLQRARQELLAERERTQQLLAEVERQNHELDQLRSSVHWESNSRLLAEEALDATKYRLQLAVDAAGLALWDWQLRSPQVYLTARWGEMLGNVAMDGYWDTTALLELVHPDDRGLVQTAARHLRTGRRQRGVVQYRVRTAGGWLWIESHGMVTEQDATGRPLRLMGTHADIGERKRVEEAGVRARELAEQASRAKSEFLANISHEVRTPLNALIGLTRLLIDSPLNPEQTGWLDLMDKSAHALLDLLNDVLDLSRIEAGKLPMENVHFLLRDTLQEVSALYGEQAHAKSLGWSLLLAPDLPERMQGDPGRLRQVLGNLLSNALKFTPRGGRIAITARVLAASATAPQRLRLQVQDSGVGIARKHQASIFDAFTQADASTARRHGGSGLGLAICSQLVKLMGGSIELVSELGQGSCFTVTLPMGNPAADAGPQSAPMELSGVAQAGRRFAGLCVLLAEDHPVNELLMQQLLTRLGCTVRLAREGEQAVAQWEQGGVDLVLMDVQMPGTNGLQAAQRIRELEASRRVRRTPIVAVTANAMPGDREACLAAGMDGYIPKPVSPQTLIRTMDEVLMRVSGVLSDWHEAVELAPDPAAATGAAPAGPLDLDALRRRLDGDDTTLCQLALAMRSDLGERLQQLQQALQARNADLAVAHAHGLKGSLGSMTAERGARLAKGLELAARSGDWPLFGRVLPLMQAEAERIDATLSALLSAEPPGD